MRRGTTPSVIITVDNTDGSEVDLIGRDLYVTFKEEGFDGYELTKRESDMTVSFEEGKTILTIPLSQEETLSFHEHRNVRVQLRCTDGESAAATNIAEFLADEILREGVI